LGAKSKPRLLSEIEDIAAENLSTRGFGGSFDRAGQPASSIEPKETLMIGSKAIAAISLLCALSFCAIAASSASAATSGTTAFTCVENTTHQGSFEDRHCETPSVPSTGQYTHKAISANPTGFTVSSEEAGTTGLVHWVLQFILVGVKAELTCTKVHGHGTLENKLSNEKHSVSYSWNSYNLIACKTPKPVTAGGLERCKVVGEELNFEATGTTTENGTAMGILVTPKEGKTFVGISFENGPGGGCPAAGKTVNLTGSAEGTPGGSAEGHGANLVFTNEMTKGAKCETGEQVGLCVGGQPAELANKITFRMLMTTEGAPEGPIALTTPPFTTDA
jgi:hypothetical protein